MGELLYLNRDKELQPKPDVIQIGTVGNALGKPHTNRVMEVLHSQKLLEKEFEKDKIPVIWSFLVGTGPAINEALEAGTVDFGHYGDICGIAGKAKGLPTTALALGGRGLNIYIAVPAYDQRTQTLEDLKGKRVGFLSGTYLHLMFEKLLSRHHLTEKDFRIHNLGFAEGTAALLAGHIDAYVDISQVIQLRDQGLVRIIYDSKAEEFGFKGTSVLVGRNEFIQKYPDITRRFIQTYVQAAYWASSEEKREEYFHLNTFNGTSYGALQYDYEGTFLRSRNNPLLDDFFHQTYGEIIRFSKQRGFISRAFDLDEWVDKRFVESAVRELGFEGFWNEHQDAGPSLGRKKIAGEK
jgi:sulfonate transport system substrate-binding protein